MSEAVVPGAVTSEFDTDTAIRREAGEFWATTVTDRWNIGSAPNGGYLLALLTRALLADTGQPVPLSVTAHYLSPPPPGPAVIRTEVLKAGRRLSVATGGLWQGDRQQLRALGTFGDPDRFEGPSRVGATPPSLPPPESCPPAQLGSIPTQNEIRHRFDFRLPPDFDWSRVEPGRPLQVAGWIRFADGRQPDPLSLVTLADAFPPAALGVATLRWAPTLELTVHVRARPAPGWVAGRFSSRFLRHGLLEEDGELWDSTGELVAHSRQLALLVT